MSIDRLSESLPDFEWMHSPKKTVPEILSDVQSIGRALRAYKAPRPAVFLFTQLPIYNRMLHRGSLVIKDFPDANGRYMIVTCEDGVDREVLLTGLALEKQLLRWAYNADIDDASELIGVEIEPEQVFKGSGSFFFKYNFRKPRKP